MASVILRGLIAAMLLLSGSCRRTETVPAFPGEFVGIGVELRMQGETPVVVRTMPGSAAEVAGVMLGDVLLEVDGRPVDGSSLGDVVMRIRGVPGSQVALTLQRGPARVIVLVRRQALAKEGDVYRTRSSAD